MLLIKERASPGTQWINTIVWYVAISDLQCCMLDY